MSNKHEAVFTTGTDKKSMKVVRSFDAPVGQVWTAWTDASILDQWWAPKPWKAETKSMDFRPGGMWLYAMVGPNEGERHWARVDYKTVRPTTNYTATDSFCDENGVINDQFPGMSWDNTFEGSGDTTRVTIAIEFKDEDALNKIVEMGFKDGFAMGMDNLDQVLAK